MYGGCEFIYQVIMEEGEGERWKSGEKITYCVTGATGYIGSWLVMSLLHRGYRVHATFRDPAKSLHLIKMLGDYDLRLFKADLQEEGSFDEAVRGCNGVFHVAASMDFSVPMSDNIESYVHKEVIDPAIKGTLNILKACSKSKSVERVVFTSSISTMTAKDNAGNWKPVVDQSCKTSVDHVWNSKASGWVYVLSKLLSEEAAVKFAKENGIDLVSVIMTTVGGPFLTPSVPSSIQILLSPITGNSELLRILDSVNSRMGSIGLVDIEDICSAHIFLMEHSRAEGGYICCTGSVPISELIHHLIQECPGSNNIYRRFIFIEKDHLPLFVPLFLPHDLQIVHHALDRNMNIFSNYRVSEEYESVPSVISSRKLADLGFEFKYGVGDIIKHTVRNCVESGFLASTENERLIVQHGCSQLHVG